MKRPLVTILTAALALLAAGTARASITPITTRTGLTDSLDWSKLGPELTFISNPFTTTTANGLTITGTYAGTGGGEQVRVQSSTWAGDFTPGDFVNWTRGNGPLTLAFGGSGVSAAGAQFDPNSTGGPFSVELSAFNGTTLLGAVFESGSFTFGAANGTGIFVGVQETGGPNITSVVFSLASCSSCNLEDFAINKLSLQDAGPSTPTPEPSTMLLFGVALAGTGIVLRRRLRETL